MITVRQLAFRRQFFFAIDEQRIRLQNAQTDYKRYQELLKEEAVTPQQFDRVKTD